MKFALSTEQLDFGSELRKLFDTPATPAAIRSWGEGDTTRGRALLRQAADAGVFGLAVAEEYDGADATPVDLVVALIELGRAAVPGPVIETAAALPALLQRLPDTEPAARWLPGLAGGVALGTIGFTGPARADAGSDTAATAFAVDTGTADLALHASGDTVSLGVAGPAVRSIDPARALFPVTAGELVATGPAVAEAIAAGFDAGVLGAAAVLLGAGRAILDQTCAYAKQRKQFGRVIGEFQSVKQQLADVLIALDLAEPLLYRAALTLDTPDRARDVSAALVACGAAAHRASRAGLQVHGAIGYTAECDLSLWLTRVAALRTAWGTADFHRGRIASALRAAG
ncbi:acyl-CoA dehydrogenase family protein [Nocardia thailandica]